MAKTVAGKVLQAIWSLFKAKWPMFVARLWNKVPNDLQKEVMLGVKIAENIKTWLGGDMAKFITHVIPGDVDEEIRLRLIKILNDIGLVDNAIYSGAFTDHKNRLWHNIATDINQHLTGMSFGQSAITTEVAYQAYKNSKK